MFPFTVASTNGNEGAVPLLVEVPVASPVAVTVIDWFAVK